MPPTSPRKLTDVDEKERDALKRGLKDVGENLPNDPVEVEGADVDEIVRHKRTDGHEEEPTDEVIREQLRDPHADVDQEVVEDLDLTEEEEED